MSDPDTVIVAHTRAPVLRRAFDDWDTARDWRDSVDGNYVLTEVLVIDE